MKNLIELSKEEAIQVQGGGAYEIGKAVGGYIADVIDYWHGLYDGIFR